jgi:LacI family transcriptional regulator
LHDQVADLLREEMRDGRWQEWMPSERILLAKLNVSRKALRDALRLLVNEGLLTVEPRQGYRIASREIIEETAPSRRRMELGLICPERIFSMPPYVIKLVDIVRGLCAEAGFQLEVLEGRRFARVDPGRMMPKVVRSFPKACWILIMADEKLQRWFERSGTPAVIYGNVYPGIGLSSVGIDYRACVRHAASMLLARGHRRIVLVAYDQKMAGERESLAGFKEAFKAYGDEGAVALLLPRPDDSADALCRQIERIMASASPPTAFVVCRTHHYATVASHLARRGRRIPEDVSPLCRGEDTFLHFLRPQPAFYRANIQTLARSLFAHLLDVVNGTAKGSDQVSKIPELVSGESLGPGPWAGR